MIPRTVNKERKRERILRAALKVFARRGTSNFKMIDVAERAGVGKGTLYEYFPSKDDLVVGTFNLVMQDYDTFVGGRIDRVKGPAAKVEGIIRATCEFFVERRDMMEVTFDLWAASVPRRGSKPLLANMGQTYHRMIGWLAGIIDEGIEQGEFKPVDSTLVSSMILATLDGLLFQAVLGLIELDAEALPDKLSQVMLEGIKK